MITLEEKAGEIGLDIATTEKLLEKFIEVSGEDIRRLKDAEEESDWFRVREIAHHIKGAAVNLNLTEIAEAGEQLESLDEKTLRRRAAEVIRNLERSFLQLRALIDKKNARD
jgi:HPt (histidine-containing phosphotransfer) domain-containing protein